MNAPDASPPRPPDVRARVPNASEADDAAATEADADALEGAIIQLMRFLKRGAPETPLAELPMAQVRGLMIVRRHEGLKMQELASKMDTTLPATSQIVDRLVKRGLVQRRDDPADRRVVRLHLQDAAREITGVLHAARRARLTQAITLLKHEGNFAKTVEGVHLLADAARRTTDETDNTASDATDSTQTYGAANLLTLTGEDSWKMPNAVLEENSSEDTKR